MGFWESVRDTYVYRPLAFAESAESLRLVHEGLAVKPGDTVAGITSSGDVLLSLLSYAPSRVLGFDTNATQTALARLKRLLIERLDPDAYKAFLGVTGGTATDRCALFEQLRPALGEDADLLSPRGGGEGGGIGAGLLRQGATVWIAGAVRLGLIVCLGREAVGRLLDPACDLAERLALHGRLVNSFAYRFVLRPILSAGAGIFQHFFYPPALCANSDHPRRALADIAGFHRALFVAGFADNPAMGRILGGRIPSEHERLFYAPQVWRAMRQNLAAASFETTPLTLGIAAAPAGSIDAFYLSNCPDYLRRPALEELAAVIAHAARPGARVVYFSLDRESPFQCASVPTPWECDATRAAELLATDPVGLYPSMGVGRIG